MGDLDDVLSGRGDADAHFAQLERTYGPTLVKDAMLHTLAAIMIRVGVVSKSEFVDGLEYRLKKQDDERRKAAGMDG